MASTEANRATRQVQCPGAYSKDGVIIEVGGGVRDNEISWSLSGFSSEFQGAGTFSTCPSPAPTTTVAPTLTPPTPVPTTTRAPTPKPSPETRNPTAPPSPSPSFLPTPLPTSTPTGVPSPVPTVACSPGEYFEEKEEDGGGGAVCRPCSIGRFQAYAGGAPWPRDCNDCAPGRFNVQEGQSECRDCAAGKLSSPGPEPLQGLFGGRVQLEQHRV